MIGVKSDPSPVSPFDSNFYAKYMWIYMLFPYAGASLAALFFKLHQHIDRNEYKQNKPMQFVGLMVNPHDNSQII